MTNFSKPVWAVFITVLLLAGCTGDKGTETINLTAPLLNIEKTLSIAETDELMFGRLADIVSDAHGRIFAGDNGQHTIHVFDVHGNRFTTIGREGRGPGEFNNINLDIVENGSLYVYDWSNSRTQVFRETRHNEWELIETIPVDRLGMAFPVRALPLFGEHLLIEYGVAYGIQQTENINPFIKSAPKDDQEKGVRHVELTTGDVAVQRTSNSVSVWGHPFGRASHSVFRGNEIYHAWGGKLAVFKTTVHNDFSHTTDTLFSIPIDPQEFTSEELNEAIENYSDEGKRAVRDLELRYKPEIRRVLVDDLGQIWIQRYVDEGEPDWFIFDQNGALVNLALFQDRFIPSHIQNGLVYGIWRDDYDVPEIQVWEITN